MKILLPLATMLVIAGYIDNDDLGETLTMELSETRAPEGVTAPTAYNIAFDERFFSVPNDSKKLLMIYTL